ncbi:Hypothetical protein BCD_1491, partial (plasmid) [Borrelia crocidurae DOU]
ELEEIIRINIEIIKNSEEYYNQEETAKYISQLRNKRNKIMNSYIRILKEA